MHDPLRHRIRLKYLTMRNEVTVQRRFHWITVMLAVMSVSRCRTEVNLRVLLHADNETCKWGIHPPLFETRSRRHQNSKTGVSVVPQKRTDVLKFFIKNLCCWYCRSGILVTVLPTDLQPGRLLGPIPENYVCCAAPHPPDPVCCVTEKQGNNSYVVVILI